MKKIISTLALATLAFGSVFADVTFTTNYRTRMVGFSRVMNADGYTKNADSAATATKPTDEKFNSYLFAQRAYDSASDDFAVAVSNDFGGAKITVNPTLATRGTADDLSPSFSEYYGYVNLGAIKLTAGLIDGINNGDYRLTGEIGHNLCGDTSDAYGQLGSMHSKAISFKADDIAFFDGKNRPVAMLTYKGEFGDTTLTADLVAAAIDSDNANNTWDGSKMHSALGARVDVKLPFAGIQFVFKQHANTTTVAKRSVALSVAPKLGENMSLALSTSLGYYNGDLTDFNGDVRFVFKKDNMSFTSLNKIGFVTDSAVNNTAYNPVGYDSHVGLLFLNSKGALNKAANYGGDSQSSMWNVLGFSMALSEKLTVFANAGDIIGFNAGKKEIGDYGMELFVAPGVQLFATKNASITTALRVGVNNLLMDKDTYKDIEPAYGILVPVVLRVQL